MLLNIDKNMLRKINSKMQTKSMIIIHKIIYFMLN